MVNDEYKFKIQQAREKYKPSDIKCLFIAEAPPNNLSRFFYYENVKDHDYLFLGIMSILYPDDKKRYISQRRATKLKEQMLYRFKADGFYLIDLLDQPKVFGDKELRAGSARLIQKVSKLIDRKTPIILTKANVFDILAPSLKEHGFNVIQERIYFPSNGRQKDFAISFARAIAQAGIKI